MRTLVTGATGNIGARVLHGLAARAVPTRASSRKPERIDAPDGVEVIHADLDNAATLTQALDGIHGVFLYAQPEQIDEFIRAATAAGVRHVVLLSSSTVEGTDPLGARHAAVERALAASPLPATFIRPGMFASNVAAWAPSIGAESVVRSAYGAARLAPVHPDDIADAAVAALCDGQYAGSALQLSGPETLTQRRLAELIGEQTGQAVRFEELTEQQHRAANPAVPEFVLDSLFSLWREATETPDSSDYTVERITGCLPRTYEQWVRENAALFTAG